jgi:hypothetical protein
MVTEYMGWVDLMLWLGLEPLQRSVNWIGSNQTQQQEKLPFEYLLTNWKSFLERWERPFLLHYLPFIPKALNPSHDYSIMCIKREPSIPPSDASLSKKDHTHSIYPTARSIRTLSKSKPLLLLLPLTVRYTFIHTLSSSSSSLSWTERCNLIANSNNSNVSWYHIIIRILVSPESKVFDLLHYCHQTNYQHFLYLPFFILLQTEQNLFCALDLLEVECMYM